MMLISYGDELPIYCGGIEGVPSECTIVRAIGSEIAGRLKAQEAGEWSERG